MLPSDYVGDAGAIERFEDAREREAREQRERREERDRRNREAEVAKEQEWAARRDELVLARDTARNDRNVTQFASFRVDKLSPEARERLDAAIYRMAAEHQLALAEAAYGRHTTRVR